MSTRRLILLRHAKAEPYADSDQERPLTDRGRRDAAAAGRHLAESGITPDHVVVSPALRTRSTWEALAEAAGFAVEPVLEPDAYAGSVEVVLDLLRGSPPGAGTVLLVGHNPTVAYLATTLDDGLGDPEATHALLSGYPPAALAVLDLSVPWSDLGPETGRVVAFHVGRG